MTVRGQLLLMLQTVAEALGEDFRERLVFVGGCTTALFITDKVTLEDVRATDDVDLIVDLAGHGEWAQLREELRQRGFAESPEDNVTCRMRLRDLKVDFMPDDAGILGFTNHWYAAGIETAVTHELTDTLRIKELSPELQPRRRPTPEQVRRAPQMKLPIAGGRKSVVGPQQLTTEDRENQPTSAERPRNTKRRTS